MADYDNREWVYDHDEPPQKRKNSDFAARRGFMPFRLAAWLMRWAWGLLRGTWRLTWRMLRGTWRFTGATLGFAGRGTAWAWRGTWRVMAALLRWSLAAGKSAFAFFMRWVFGVDPPISQPEYDQFGNPIFDAIRQRVGRRYRRRGRFLIASLVFLVLTAAAWVDVSRYSHSLPGSGAALPITIFLGTILAIHAVNLLVSDAEDRATEREIERQRVRGGYDASTDDLDLGRRVRLSDDGELVEVHFNDHWQAEPKRKTQ